MRKNKKTEILRIKDLKVVFFYNLDDEFSSSKNTDLLGLKIVYGDNETLSFDYTDSDFNEFVLKVVNTYNNEKDKNNIILLNELTENLLNNLQSLNNIDSDNNLFYQDKAVMELRKRNNNLEIVKPYIKDVIFTMKDLIFEGKEFEVKNITGYHNRYFIACKINKRDSFIPFSIIKNGTKEYIFKIGSIGNDPITINGVINIEAGTVNINWKIGNSELVGYEVFKYDNVHERSIYNFEKIIDFDNRISEINSCDRRIIENYFRILGLDNMNKGIKIGDNRFLLGSNEIDDISLKNATSTEIAAHVMLTDNSLDIIYSKKFGLVKYNNSLIVPISEEYEEITVLPINIDNDYYLLIQRHYNSTRKMRGEYSDKVGKNNYQVFKINAMDSMRDFEGILEEYEIRKNIDSIEDIKKYIKKGQKV